MTPAKFSLNGRRLATLTVFGLVVLLPLGWIVWCLYAASMLDATMADQSQQLDRLTQRIEALKVASHGHPEEADLSSLIYFAGETPTMAGAAIQQRMADAIAAESGRVIESQVMPADPTVDDPGRVDLRISFDTKVTGLQRILHAVETGMPFMFIKTIDVRSLAEKDSDLDTDPTLRVELVVGGYQRAGGA